MQASPSEQALPLTLTGFEQTPDAVSQVPALWHWSEAAHVTGLAPAQAPDWHVSVCVHAFPSEHTLPLALAGLEQTPLAELHVPAAWH